MSYLGSLAFSRILRNHSTPPAASTLAHSAGVSLMDRCTSRSSSGLWGRPPTFFGFSMAQVYVMQKHVDKPVLLNHNNRTENAIKANHEHHANDGRTEKLNHRGA